MWQLNSFLIYSSSAYGWKRLLTRKVRKFHFPSALPRLAFLPLSNPSEFLVNKKLNYSTFEWKNNPNGPPFGRPSKRWFAARMRLLVLFIHQNIINFSTRENGRHTKAAKHLLYHLMKAPNSLADIHIITQIIITKLGYRCCFQRFNFAREWRGVGNLWYCFDTNFIYANINVISPIYPSHS